MNWIISSCCRIFGDMLRYFVLIYLPKLEYVPTHEYHLLFSVRQEPLPYQLGSRYISDDVFGGEGTSMMNNPRNEILLTIILVGQSQLCTSFVFRKSMIRHILANRFAVHYKSVHSHLLTITQSAKCFCRESTVSVFELYLGIERRAEINQFWVHDLVLDYAKGLRVQRDFFVLTRRHRLQGLQYGPEPNIFTFMCFGYIAPKV